MNLKMTRVDLWAADIDDHPGALSRALQALADYGADLDNIQARRLPDKSGKGLVLVSPLTRHEQRDNADQAGFHRAGVPLLKLEGNNAFGLGAKLTKLIADTGVNLNGFDASVLGSRFVCYVGFDSLQELEKAETALKPLTAHHWPFWPMHHHTTKAA